MSRRVPFNRPFIAGRALQQIEKGVEAAVSTGGAPYVGRCERLLEERFTASRVLLTPSCTAALELAALLGGIEPGDEVIMPSFTFPSTANGFVLRGARPVFVDIRPDTLNLDESRLEGAVTERTRAIVPVHYAGVACDMRAISAVARRHRLLVIEDAALAFNARYRDSYLGTLGDLGAYSFHETKGVSCGEGGALVVNAERFLERSEVIREKGTNRMAFLRGEAPFYTWIDVGSSYGLAELLAAHLYPQLAGMDRIAERGRAIHRLYREQLRPLAERGLFRLPVVSDGCTPNWDIFHVRLAEPHRRPALIEHLRDRGITAEPHYVPLHTSPMGERMGYRRGMLPVTEEASERLLRLPVFSGMTGDDARAVTGAIAAFFGVQSA